MQLQVPPKLSILFMFEKDKFSLSFLIKSPVFEQNLAKIPASFIIIANIASKVAFFTIFQDFPTRLAQRCHWMRYEM